MLSLFEHEDVSKCRKSLLAASAALMIIDSTTDQGPAISIQGISINGAIAGVLLAFLIVYLMAIYFILMGSEYLEKRAKEIGAMTMEPDHERDQDAAMRDCDPDSYFWDKADRLRTYRKFSLLCKDIALPISIAFIALLGLHRPIVTALAEVNAG